MTTTTQNTTITAGQAPMWELAYKRAWRASDRNDRIGGSDAATDYAARILPRVAPENRAAIEDAALTGWNDQAVGNDYQPFVH